MKTFDSIAKEATSKDYYIVADIADCSPKNVQLVVRRMRGDHFNIQQIFSEFLGIKEELKRKYRKARTKRIAEP
jgi:hypothetical protein